MWENASAEKFLSPAAATLIALRRTFLFVAQVRNVF